MDLGALFTIMLALLALVMAGPAYAGGALLPTIPSTTCWVIIIILVIIIIYLWWGRRRS